MLFFLTTVSKFKNNISGNNFDWWVKKGTILYLLMVPERPIDWSQNAKYHRVYSANRLPKSQQTAYFNTWWRTGRRACPHNLKGDIDLSLSSVTCPFWRSGSWKNSSALLHTIQRAGAGKRNSFSMWPSSVARLLWPIALIDLSHVNRISSRCKRLESLIFSDRCHSAARSRLRNLRWYTYSSPRSLKSSWSVPAAPTATTPPFPDTAIDAPKLFSGNAAALRNQASKTNNP